MFSKYYQSELTYLRDMGRLFGESNPTIAGLLAERGGDPDVERLLEGFAFLTARTRERIDDSVPEIVHALCELLTPHYLRSIPASTIIEFLPQIGALRGRHQVPRGTPLGATPVRDTACTFRTTADTELLPLVLENTVLDEASATRTNLRIEFECAEKGLPSVFEPGGIRLFIAEDYAVASTLFLWFQRYCVGIELTGRDNPDANKVTLPVDCLKTVGFGDDAALLPWPRFSPQGFRMLQEYFTLPSKFLFIDVTGLDRALQVEEERFAITFTFDRPPALTAPVGRQTFRLHCVPAVNLFERAGSPIRKSAIEHEHLLRAADIDPAHMEIYAIDSVTSAAEGRGDRVYRPFVDFSHASLEEEASSSYYTLRKVASPIDGGIDTYFSIATPRDKEPDTGDEVFSIDLTCTNRFLGGDLQAGDISQPIVGSPAVARFKNISEVTKPVRPPLGGELYWRLLAHLGLNHSSLANAESLRSFLGLYNFQALTDHAVGRANRLRTEAVAGVETTPTRRMLEGMPVRGGHTRVELQEEKFASEGDAFVFGCILDELFADRVSINSFNELSIKLRGSQGEYKWLPRAGKKTIV